MKADAIHGRHFDHDHILLGAVATYIRRRYNRRRLHSSLDKMPRSLTVSAVWPEHPAMECQLKIGSISRRFSVGLDQALDAKETS